MEVIFIFILACAAFFFFLKWQQAAENSGRSEAKTGARSNPDPILLALQRIENKVDSLALDRKFAAEPVPVREAAGPARVAAGSEPTVTSKVPEASAIPPLTSEPVPDAVSAPSAKPGILFPVEPPRTTAFERPSFPEPQSQWEAKRSAWENEARLILGRIWSWVLVGEEFRPKGVSLEFAMAGTWLMRVGVVVLVSCVVWFLKWSMVHGILGPSGRVGLSFAAGVGLTGFGFRLMGKRYQVMGQGLMGGGIAALYFAAYASGPLYHLLPQLACFAMMALITLAGCVLAAGTRSQVTAILAMMGGYATPVLLSTGVANFPGLFAYMFLLGGGILGLAIYRNWRLLHYLAFAAHWILVFGSLRAYHQTEHFSVVLPFLILFFAQQHGVSVGYAFRRAVPISILEAVQQFLHAGLFAGLGYQLILDAAGRPWPALLAIGLAVVFILQTLAVLKRMPTDRLSLSVSLGLSGFFTAWSVPLLFNGSSLTVAWSLMALAWLWAGLRIGSKLLVLGSQILFLLAGARLGAFDFTNAYFNTHFNGAAGGIGSEDFSGYLKGLSLRLINFGVFIGSLFIAARLYRNRPVTESLDRTGLHVAPEADLPFPTPFQTAGVAAFAIGFLFLFVVVHFEATRLLGFLPILQAPGTILVWSAFAGYLAFRFRKSASPNLGLIIGAALALVCLRMALVDWVAMGFDGTNWRFADAGLQLAFRSLAHGALGFLLWSLGRGRFGLSAAPAMARGYRIAAVSLLFLVITLETRTVSAAFVPGFQSGALSIVWALFAMGLVAGGLRVNDRMARFTGLLLFALVAGKVFLLDLASLDMIWRVLSFLAVGSVLLLGSFAYLRASRPEAGTVDSLGNPDVTVSGRPDGTPNGRPDGKPDRSEVTEKEKQ